LPTSRESVKGILYCQSEDNHNPIVTKEYKFGTSALSARWEGLA